MTSAGDLSEIEVGGYVRIRRSKGQNEESESRANATLGCVVRVREKKKGGRVFSLVILAKKRAIVEELELMISLCLADLAGGPEQISGKCNLLPLTPIRVSFTSVTLLHSRVSQSPLPFPSAGPPRQ